MFDLFEETEARVARLRSRITPSWDSVEEDDPRAMVFVVNNPHDVTILEQDVLTAAIEALAGALLSDRPSTIAAVDAWLAGRIRKIIKRARNKAWTDLNDLPEYATYGVHGEASVKAFEPMPVSALPAPLRKLQVSGLDYPRDEAPVEPQDHVLEVVLDDTLHLSTGKAVAQVCHAAQLFLMYADLQNVYEWIELGYPTRFRYSEHLAQEKADIEVRDAGFTEVAPNTLTVIARWVP